MGGGGLVQIRSGALYERHEEDLGRQGAFGVFGEGECSGAGRVTGFWTRRRVRITAGEGRGCRARGLEIDASRSSSGATSRPTSQSRPRPAEDDDADDDALACVTTGSERSRKHIRVVLVTAFERRSPFAPLCDKETNALERSRSFRSRAAKTALLSQSTFRRVAQTTTRTSFRPEKNSRKKKKESLSTVADKRPR